MYAEYAKDPRMKINVGIRRRLAPLLDNGRDEIELLHAILFSLPGSPVLYYGDEIVDGRQRLPRRPRRRAHADAVDRRPQRRLLPRGLRAALRAAADGPGLRLPGGQRRGPAAHADVAAALAAALHRAAQGAPGLRPRHLRAAATRRTRGSSPTSAATRTTSCCACTTSRARRRPSSSTCREFEGRYPVEMFGRSRFPRDRRAALPADARAARLLLVPAAWRRTSTATDTSTRLPAWTQRWFGSKSREVAARRRPRGDPAARRRRRSRSSRSRFRAGHARDSTRCVRAGPTATARRARGRTHAGALLLDLMREGADVEHERVGRCAFRCGSEPRRRDRRAVRPVGRRAVQLVDRLRRRADPEGVPPRSSRAINPELELLRFLDRARLPAHRPAAPAGTSSRAG